jgi:molecular chaperone GrpE
MRMSVKKEKPVDEQPEVSEDAEAEDSIEDGAEEAPEDGTQESEPAGDEQTEDADVKYMRLAADFQNYKKRTEKERFERYAEGKKDLAADILPVIDNFERAVSEEMLQDAAVAEGLEMLLKQLRDVLAKNGIMEIEALGTDFDPNLHHAVMMEASEDYESGKVTEVLQKGYTVNDKTIRPAMVKVAE